jgi:hypothetical protein
MLGVVPREEPLTEGLGVLVGAEPVREVGPVLEGLELGLGGSVTCGRLCEGTTPRVAKNSATGWEVIDGLRSAWMVSRSGPICCRAQLPTMSVLTSAALSWRASSQPTT